MFFKRLYYRSYQRVFRLAANFLHWREPQLLEGAGCLSRLPTLVEQRALQSLLLVTDQVIRELGLADKLLQGLQERGIRVSIYDGTVPNPSIQNIEEALALYHQASCQGIIGLGGGSALDCAKAVAARVARPRKSLEAMRGQLGVRRRIPPFFAVPTTAGTGSEGTLAAVISNPETHEKYAINDTVLIPHVAVLDPLLLTGLPASITAATGLDALTHGVEAYMGRSNTRQTRAQAREAVQLIFAWLQTSWKEPGNLEARSAMLRASYLAGRSFTRAYVGYVHAVAHSLGAFYGVPHGLANAVLLPIVLEYYGTAVHRPLAELARVAGVAQDADSTEVAARKFIQAIRDLNRALELPEKLKGIQVEDIPAMASRALREANPLYPVPRILFRKEVEELYRLVRA